MVLETGNAWPPELDCEPLAAGTSTHPASVWRGTGFFNPMHPPTLSVCGSAAVRWAAAHTALEIEAALAASTTILLDPAAATCQALRAAAGHRAWHCLQSAHVAVAVLREAAMMAQGPTSYRHGVLVQLWGLGLLIEGARAAGKSELALELIQRGHALVADDAVALWRLAPNLLVGTCPEPLFGFLHARSLGLLHVPSHTGPGHCARRARIDLAIQIEAAAASAAPPAQQLLEGAHSQIEIAGGRLPQLRIAVDRPAALAARVEIACRQHWTQLAGWRAVDALSTRQAELIRRSCPAAALS